MLGSHLNSYLCNQLINYYEGDKLILVNETPHHAERLANIVIHERVDDLLERLIRKLG